MLVLLAAAFTVLAGISFRSFADDWPSRVTLKTPRDTWSLAFSPDGRTLLTAGEGGITPWDASTGRKGTPWATKGGDSAVAGAYSPDGRTFAAAIFRHPELVEIELIDTATGRTRGVLKTQHPSVYHIGFTQDGRAIRAYLGDGTRLKEAVTWDSASGRQMSSRAITAPIRWSITAISPDGRLLAFVPFRTSFVQLWDLEADRLAGALNDPSTTGTLGRGVGFSADGKTLASGRDDGAIDLWDIPTRKLVATLPGHFGGRASAGIRFAPDGRTLVSTGNEMGRKSAIGRIQDGLERGLFGPRRESESEVIVVDLATGQRVARASTSHFPLYSPDGRTIVTRQRDLSFRLRDLPQLPK